MASQPEFLLASLAFILLMMIPATTILIHQSYTVYYVRMEESRNKEMYQLIYGLLHCPGDPPNWWSAEDVNLIHSLGFSSTSETNSLDPHKIFRLVPRNKHFLKYSDFSKILGLDDIAVQMKILYPFNVSIEDPLLDWSRNRAYIVITTRAWDGTPLPSVDLLIIGIYYNFFRLMRYSSPLDFNLKINRTDENGQVEVSLPMIMLRRYEVIIPYFPPPYNNISIPIPYILQAILVFARYHDCLYALCYKYIPNLENIPFNITIRELNTASEPKGSLNVTLYSNYDISGTITSLIINPKFSSKEDILFINETFSISRNISASKILRIPSKGVGILILYVQRFFLYNISIIVWPPVLGYFPSEPYYGPDISHPDLVYQEVLLMRGFPYLVVVKCDY